MKATFDSISWHITGNYPLRELSAEDRADYSRKTLVHFPRGFETLQVAVYHDGQEDFYSIEAALEFLEKKNLKALDDSDLENAYCESQRLYNN
jgi:hypothetical protein